MPQFQGATRILVHEHAFDRNDIGEKLCHDTADRLEYLAQSIREGAINALDGAARYVTRRVTLKIEDTEPGQARAWINAEYASFVSQRSIRALPVRLR